ncbi:anti-sigma factor family protein [Paenibacillus harenae]|uniref:anti-sigma factor family protein n=1 Tax=Paenibacillus harenae TaxID=306543 RepID=UPI0003FA2641|nr:zf-HC2 domain-containing protein [Paenibacillus harenae]
MNCQEVMELMQRQLDDDLDESEMVILNNHTRQCPDCAAMLERLQLLSAELTSLPKVTPSYSLVDAIMPQLERIELFGQTEAAAAPVAGDETFETGPRRAKRERRWPSIRVMSGVIAAGIVAGLFLVTYKSGNAPNFNLLQQSANESNAAADTAANASPKEYAFSANAEDGPAAPEVGTETMRNRDAKAEDQSVTDSQSDDKAIIGKSASEPDSGASDGGQVREPSGEAEGSASDGGGSNSSGGSTGSLGDGADDSGQPGEPQQGITAVKTAVVSPDGKYKAKAEGFSIKIYAESDQSVVVESPRKNGSLTNLVWSEDSAQLTYEVHVEKGAIEKYVFDMKTGEEKKAEH